MQSSWLRRVLHKGGPFGILFVGSYFLARHLWERQRALVVFAALLLALNPLFLPHICRPSSFTGRLPAPTAAYSLTEIKTPADGKMSVPYAVNASGQR